MRKVLPEENRKQLKEDDAAKRDQGTEKKHKSTGKSRGRRAAALVLLLAAVLLTVFVLIPSWKYYRAGRLVKEGSYEEAVTLYSSLHGFRDSEEKILEARYLEADDLRERGNYDQAIALYEELGSYKDSAAQITETMLAKAQSLVNRSRYQEALDLLDGMEDSAGAEEIRKAARYGRADALIRAGKPETAAAELLDLGDYEYSETKYRNTCYELARNALLTYDFTAAESWLEQAGQTKDAPQLLELVRNAADYVYTTPYLKVAGADDVGTSYLWLHSVLSPGSAAASLMMQEDFTLGELDGTFGGDPLDYSQKDWNGKLTWYYDYSGREDGTWMLGALSSDFKKLRTERVDADTHKKLAASPQTRNWKLVTVPQTADAVREGFRTRKKIELANKGNAAFYNMTDSARVNHVCSDTWCTKSGIYSVKDADTRRWYCADHYEEYTQDPAYDSAKDPNSGAEEKPGEGTD